MSHWFVKMTTRRPPVAGVRVFATSCRTRLGVGGRSCHGVHVWLGGQTVRQRTEGESSAQKLGPTLYTELCCNGGRGQGRERTGTETDPTDRLLSTEERRLSQQSSENGEPTPSNVCAWHTKIVRTWHVRGLRRRLRGQTSSKRHVVDERRTGLVVFASNGS